MIPRILIRTVPEHTREEVEQFWKEACELHPTWRHVTLRDPLDPAQFPMTSPHWARCTSGAQLAGLVRLEALWQSGGVYIDSDVEVYRRFDTLLRLEAFAAYEDPGVIPDAVLGAHVHHLAIKSCLALAIGRLIGTAPRPHGNWTDDAGAWSTGPGVTTSVLPGRLDVTLLPPASFYPAHYSVKAKTDWAKVRAENPWAFGAHRWHASWC